MSTAIRRVGRVLPLLACAVLPAVCMASREVPVFTVDISAQTPSAVRNAMRVVLVRATGHASVASDPKLAQVLAQASQYVQGYHHGSGGQLQVTFNGPALDRAIDASGRSLWNADRPFTLIVLSPQPAGASAQAADAAAVQKAAQSRGLPISVVPLRVRGASGRLLPAEALLAMAHSLGGEQLLVGHDLSTPLPTTSFSTTHSAPVPAPTPSTPSGAGSNASTGPSDNWRWTLVTPFITRQFTGSVTTGVDRTVDFLAPPAHASAANHITKTVVRVEGLKTLDEYARVETMLAAVPGVHHSTVARVDGTTAVFNLWARGGAANIRHMLGISPRFKPSAASSALAYRYVPAPAPSGTSDASTAATQSATSTDQPAAPPP